MSTYTKKKCSNCGCELEGWTRNNEFWREKIGEPFMKCPNCQAELRCLQYDEYIMIKRPIFFIFRYLLIDLFKSIIIGGMIAGFILVKLDVFFDTEFILSVTVTVLSISVFFALHCLALNISIKKSIKRTNNFEYRKKLYERGCISKEKLYMSEYDVK